MKGGWVVGAIGVPRGVEKQDIVQDCLVNMYRHVIGQKLVVNRGHMSRIVSRSVFQRWLEARSKGRVLASVIEPLEEAGDVDPDNWFDLVTASQSERLADIILTTEIEKLVRPPTGGLKAAEVSKGLALAAAECLEARGESAAADRPLADLAVLDKRKKTGTENRARRSRLDDIQRDFGGF